MIAPEKNLIGFPISEDIYSSDYTWSGKYSYLFFSYEDGEFVQRGEITVEQADDSDAWYADIDPDRALYIGDYVYVLSGNHFLSMDIGTLSVVDEIVF